MSTIRQNDLIESIAEAYQLINRQCPSDYKKALEEAVVREVNPRRRDIVQKFLMRCAKAPSDGSLIHVNPEMAIVFMRVGQDVRWSGFTGTLKEAVHEGIARACSNLEVLPSAKTVPVFVHWSLVPGEQLEIKVAARSAEAESRTRLVMMDPKKSIADVVVSEVELFKSEFQTPVVLGIGSAGTSEKAVLTARECLFDPINMEELQNRGPQTTVENLRTEIFHRINGQSATSDGAIRTPVLDVKIRLAAATVSVKPVCLMFETDVARRIRFVMDGSGPVFFD